MRVLFIIPPEEGYIGASAHAAVDRKREARPKLGILYVATYLQKYRPNDYIKVLDCPSLGAGYSKIEEMIRSEKPDVVGLTCLTFTYPDAIKTARLIKSVNRSIKVCLGGIHPTLYPRETLLQDSVDYIVIGEGEKAFAELLSHLEENKPLYRVKGLGFKDKGQIKINEPQELPVNLDELPFPDYNLLDISRYSHVLGLGDITLSIQTSRGCPFACIFCDIRKTKYRYRSAANVIMELQQWLNKGIRSFFFVDDNFVLLKDRAIEICKMIVERKWDIDFKISARIDTLDKELMSYLKCAGCSRVSLGVESSHQKYLDYLQKGTSIDRAIKTIKEAHEVGLSVFAYVIMGFPGETWEEMRHEVKFLKEQRVEYASFSLLTAYPKTAIYKSSLEKGILSEDVWQRFALSPSHDFQAPLLNKLYSQKRLRKLQHHLTREFYFNLSSMRKRFLEIKSFSQFKRYVKMGQKILFER